MASITGSRVAVSALFALDGGLLGGWMAHLPDAQRQYGMSAGLLGTVLVATSVGALLAMTLTARLIHRFGSRRVSVTAAVGVLAIVPLPLRTPSIPVLVLTLFGMGAANGTLDVAMNAQSMVVQERFDRPILSSVHGWFCIGGFLGGLGTALANAARIAPQNHLLVASLIGAVALAALAPALLPEIEGTAEGARFVLPRGRLLAIGLITLVAFFSEGVLWDWSAVLLRTGFGASATVAALGFGVGAGSMAVGRLFGDALVARAGPPQALCLSGLLTCGGILLAVATPFVPVAFLGFAVAGLGLANAVPILFAASARVPGVSPGAGLAAVTSLGYAAFLGGPPLVGHIAEVTSLRVGVGLVGFLAATIGLLGPRNLEKGESGKTS